MKKIYPVILASLLAGLGTIQLHAATPETTTKTQAVATDAPAVGKESRTPREKMRKMKDKLPEAVREQIEEHKDRINSLTAEMRDLKEAMGAELKALGKKASQEQIESVKNKYALERLAIADKLAIERDAVRALVKANLPPLPDNLKPYQQTIDGAMDAMKANREQLKSALQTARTEEEKQAAIANFRESNKAYRNTIVEARKAIRKGMRDANLQGMDVEPEAVEATPDPVN
ncbi:MAG: hypothetical protein SFY80_01670 [Verrucomicrobiota bacterium]|nr:hypothetical protein [Verrucomicrobiota bacterium]